MKREVLYTMQAPYRAPQEILGYRFGEGGEKACCVVGAMRGNEIQQQYVCALLVRSLRELEDRGALAPENEILVIPSAGGGDSMNTGHRFQAVQDIDLNRCFPGYEAGSTAQRLADGIFRHIRDFTYGIELTSLYHPGDFVPHVRVMETGYQSTSLANLFGLPFVVLRQPRLHDVESLNYNWQLWHVNAFSLFTPATDRIDHAAARQAVDAILRFLTRLGLIHNKVHNGFIASVVREEDMIRVMSPAGGVFRALRHPGEEIQRGEAIGEVSDPFTGEITARVIAPESGMIFFAYDRPLVTEHSVVFRILNQV